MNKLIGQHLIIGLQGKTLSKDEEKFITTNNIGGIVLFERNIETPNQLFDLCQHIQSLRTQMLDKAPLFISIDMEGGRVQRLKEPFTKWASLKTLGTINSATVAFHFAYAMGCELHSVGINLNFAPCVDILSNPNNVVIGDRSIGSDPDIVDKLASALVRGYIKANIIPCAKHFPGHGNTTIDSHEALPIENKTMEQVKSFELLPFKKAFRARLDMVMTAHIKFSGADPEWPVTLSRLFLQDLVRTELRFKGIIITDDLDMGALVKNYDRNEIPVRAVEAGCDMLLFCNDPLAPFNAIDVITKAVSQGRLTKAQLETSHRKILDLKSKKIVVAPQTFDVCKKMISDPKHKALSEAIFKGSVPASLLGN